MVESTFDSPVGPGNSVLSGVVDCLTPFSAFFSRSALSSMSQPSLTDCASWRRKRLT